jgi:hypothetical protein
MTGTVDLWLRALVWPTWRACVVEEASSKPAEAKWAKARAALLALRGLGWPDCGRDG